MTREETLSRELGKLQRDYTLMDKSPENIAKGERIKEIKKELGLVTKQKKNRRPPRIIWG